jgi:CTD small phosphatase-like protein 2
MESINSDFKNKILKSGNGHMSRNEYIDFIRKQHKKIINTKSYDMNYQNILKIPINDNIIEKNEIKSNSNEKNSSIISQIKNNIKNQINKEHKKTNSLTIQLLDQKFKKKSIIKSPPKKKQATIIYKNNRNNPLYGNIFSIEEISNENIENEPIIQNENIIEKENSTLSTSKITTPEKRNNDSFENYDSIIINGENNRKVKYFIKSARNKKKNTNYFKQLNSNNYSNNINYSNRNNEKENNLNNNFFSYYTSFENYTNFNNNDLSLNIEDLIMIEDKFNKLIKSVNEENTNIINKICFEWWNYYFNCSFKGNCDYLFTEFENKNLITYHNTLLLISIILIYDMSFKRKVFSKISDYMKKIILINYQNYLTICLSLINRIKPEYLNSKWVEQLKKIIFSKIKNNNFLSNELEKNLYSLNQLLSMVINIFNNNNFILNSKIPILYKNYMKYDSESINKIFMTNIIHIENKGGSLLYSTRTQSNPIINSSFLKNPPSKNLTLVLDLDETLMSFIYINKESKEGLLRIRPYLYNFLNLVKEYYEIIIFTAATKNYADPILDNIEVKRGKYFNYRLYREHCSIINNDFIKDISLIGRDLSKVIIVDNMQQNFKLQKENGILISSFWGEDDNDKVLLQLGRILVSIAIDMVETKYNLDVRNEIKKYKEDIIKSVSMS